MGERRLAIHMLDLRSELSCAKIVHAAPGHDIGILVRDSGDAEQRGILARGTLSEDRTRFHVTVVTQEGLWVYDWNYERVLSFIRSRTP
jgi:hypothetical protein